MAIDTTTYDIQQIQAAQGRFAPTEGHAWALLLCWPLILAMIVRCAFFVRQRPGGDYAQVDAYNLVNIVVTFAIAAILLIRLQDVVLAVREGGTTIKCIVFYYATAAVAGLLSSSPEYSTFRVLEFLSCFWAVMIMLKRSGNFLKAERVILIWMGLILALEIGGQIQRVGWGHFHTNKYSITAAMLFGYSFGEFALATGRRKQLLVISSAIGLGGVLLGTSTGSNLALVGGLIVLLVLSPRHGRYMLFSIPALLLIGSWSRFLELILSGKSLEQVFSFSNRMGVWTGSWNLFIQRPLLGYGMNIATRQHMLLTSSHNSYLEALLAGGVLGAGVLFFGCLVLLRDLRRNIKMHTPGSLGCCVATIVYLINGVSAPTIGYILTPHGIAFAFLLALFAYHVRCPVGSEVEPLHIPSAQWSQISRLCVYKKAPEPSTEVP